MKSEDVIVRDWPTISIERHSCIRERNLESGRNKVIALLKEQEKDPIRQLAINWYVYNWLLRKSKKRGYKLDNFINRWMVKRFLNPVWAIGTDFINAHELIVTDRLHVAILCTLLGKECVLQNNSYGKNVHFYDTWLKDVENIQYVNT